MLRGGELPQTTAKIWKVVERISLAKTLRESNMGHMLMYIGFVCVALGINFAASIKVSVLLG